MRRDGESSNDCFPALGEGFRVKVPLLTESTKSRITTRTNHQAKPQVPGNVLK